MSAASIFDGTAPPVRPVAVRARAGWMALALLPGLALQAWVFGAAFGERIAAVLAIAFVLELTGARASGMRNPQPLLMALVAACWLPVGLSWWLGMMAAAIAWSCARAFGKVSGGSAFHPAMVGCAIALAFVPRVPIPPAGDTMALAIAAAFGVTGLALAASRCIRWQLPLGVLLGATLVSFSCEVFGVGRPPQDALFATLPALQITAFLVASDPSSGCMSPRARWIFAFCIGVLVRVALLGLTDIRGTFLGMAGAVLLMNAAAPWLDRILPAIRRTPEIAE